MPNDIRLDLDKAMNGLPSEKISKQKAGYSVGKPNAHCSLCEHFRAPHACEIVLGRIDPEKWCRYFRKKPA